MTGNAGIGAAGGSSAMGGVGDSDMDIEFGYCSEEESIFQSFSQDMERVLPKVSKKYSLKEDPKGTRGQIKDVLKRYTDQTRTFEFMIKFKIEMDSEDSSSIYSASGTTPMAVIDEREKKKFLKVILSLNLSKYRKRFKSEINSSFSTKTLALRTF
jgi:hypothetical protein